MRPSREPLKYLTYYPFSVLTVAKTFILVIKLGRPKKDGYFCRQLLLCGWTFWVIYVLSISVWQWKPHPRIVGVVVFLVPILNLLGCALALISLWFMVQKFYWKRVELAFDLSGVALSLIGMCILLLNYNKDSSVRYYIALNHLLVTIAWSFCLFWSRFFTSNTVSNLFISEWGRGTEDIEIEALEGHF